MRRTALVCIGLYFVCFPSAMAQSYAPEKKNKMLVQDKVAAKAFAVPIQTVTLLDGPFKKAMEVDAAYLLTIEPDRLLSDFRSHAGLKPKAERYGGWESSGLAGHTLGHYLSACALHYAATGDKRFLDKVNYIVEELAVCQPARKGYLGAIPKEDSIWAEVQKGNIRSRGFDLNGAWSPWYTVHKIMAGLLDAYLYCNNTAALEIQKKFADWSEDLLKGLNEEQFQKMLLCEYGGMNEVLANTYALTNDKRYLTLSYRFHDRRVLDSLALGKDVLPGKHSNTQIPKLIGGIRRYELDGTATDKAMAEFFWSTVVDHHTYAAGGNSNYEYFGPPDELSETLTDNTMETCNTYNMLKLTRHLFAMDPRASYFDYYENGLYNHILSSQNHETGMTCYFVPLRMGGRKHFSDPFNTFTCCVGSGIENHVKYGEAIYAAGSDGSFYINLFIPSEIKWPENNRQLKMETSLPDNNTVSITLANETPETFTLRIRKPHWSKQDVLVSINGKKEKVTLDEKGYLDLKRRWKKDDQIQLQFGLGVYEVSMPDNQNRKAFFYGPVLLAGEFGKTEPDPVSGIPVIVSNEKDPSRWLQKNDQTNAVFASLNVGKPRDISFRPFNQVATDYYSVYFDVFSPDGWKTQQAKYEEEKQRLRDIEQKTVDVLRMGEMQPERDHSLTGESNTGEGHGKKWRSARPGGSISFDLKINGQSENELLLTYWGMDNRGRIFDIIVDGQTIATEDINKYKGSRFYDVPYPIPVSLTKGKEKVTVTLKGKPGNSVGPVYGDARIIKK
ncbi:MAG: glycoside hydrolase family 127 protein [Bacteroidota bacterium]